MHSSRWVKACCGDGDEWDSTEMVATRFSSTCGASEASRARLVDKADRRAFSEERSGVRNSEERIVVGDNIVYDSVSSKIWRRSSLPMSRRGSKERESASRSADAPSLGVCWMMADHNSSAS